MRNTSRNVRHAVRVALTACATTAAVPLVYAQTAAAPAAPAPAETVQEVVVTGSRIAQAPNDISISPINSVTSVDIQQTGLVRTEDILNNLPQVVAEQSSGTSISSTGTATVSLRGLGSQRTLVLIDGRRMNPGASGGVASGSAGSNANAADINQIPADLIERADVLTGGASAVYGADAVAGVVNFVLNTHYEGVRLDADYGFNNHHNGDQGDLGLLAAAGDIIPPSTVNTGQNRQLNFLVGSNFADGKGNATAYFGYLNSGAAVGYQFDHAGCTLNGGSTPTAPIACGGSGTSAHGQFLELGKVGGVTQTIIDNAVDPKTGAFRPYNPAVDDYNYGALSYFQRPAERWTAGAFLHYDVNEHASVYTETMFARNTSTAQYGPSGSFFAPPIIETNCANPLLTAQEVSTFCNPTTLAENQALYGLSGNNFNYYLGRRSVESGGRTDNYTSDSIRQVIGVKGDITDAWNYDTYAQVGITQFADREGDFLGQQQIANATTVIANPATGGVPGVAPGAPVCAAALPGGSAPTCVPWNVYVPGGVTQAQLNYLLIPVTYQSQATEYVWDGSVTGDLGKYGVKLPTANGGLNVNVGSEYRQEQFIFAPDYIFLNGLQDGGAPSKAIDGEFHVWEGFMEARLPILDQQPGAYLLSVDTGYRYSAYQLGFDTNTYKFGVEYAPIQDVRLRAGYNRAVRAPNIDELFTPGAVGAGGTADPCWGASPQLSETECAKTGVAKNEYGHIVVNSAAQINNLVAGNRSLTPEIADTYTFGVVLQPEFIPNFVTSVDIFNITIKNTITQLSTNTVIVDCAEGIDPSLCSLIHRGQGGSLWLSTTEYVDTTTANIGKVSTRGADLSSHYHVDIGALGRVGFGLSGTYTKNFTTQPDPNGPGFDCAGFWGTTCGAPLPHWRHVLNTNWAAPWAGLDITARWRFIGPSSVDRSSNDPQLAAPFYPQTAHIPGYNYIDLSASLPVVSNVDFRVGVNNIADKNPPLILNGTFSDCPNTSCNNNTWVGTYDTLGRYIYAHISAKF